MPSQHKRVLITTYTNNGVDTANYYITMQNGGLPSSRVSVYSWFRFLLIDIIKPYQSFITGINTIKTFDFSIKYGKVNYVKKGIKERYITKYNNIDANYASEMAYTLIKDSKGLPIKRLSEIYSYIFIDEIQDMAGYDLDIIEELMRSNINIICVGDPLQATFKTNTGPKNQNSSGKNVDKFFTKLAKKGIVEIEYDYVSQRFNEFICSFAHKVHPRSSAMTTSLKAQYCDEGVFLIKPSDAKLYYDYYKPAVLRYDTKTNTNGWDALNFGQCKGMSFDRVLIFPNKTLLKLIFDDEELDSPEKYYVAVTRPRFSVAFVVDNFKTKLDFSLAKLSLGNESIDVMRFGSNPMQV